MYKLCNQVHSLTILQSSLTSEGEGLQMRIQERVLVSTANSDKNSENSNLLLSCYVLL